MFAAVIVLHVIASLALILIVLLQAGKGVGIANVFGGAGQSVFGARTGDVLSRGTEICAGLFMLTSLVLASMSAARSGSVMNKRSVTQAESAPITAQQQAAMAKMKEALAGMAQTVKQAATAQQPAATPAQEAQSVTAEEPAAATSAETETPAQPAAEETTATPEPAATPAP